MRRFALIAVLLSACTLGTPGGDTATGAAPEVIEVTPLDSAAAAPAAETDAEAEAEAAPETAPETAPGSEPETPPETPPEAAPEAAAEAASGAGSAATPEAEALPEPPPAPALSPEAQACVKRGGRWVGTGSSGLMACVRVTRDAGKSCRRQSDCQGYCLARSGTCAPYTPLFGCHEVLGPAGERTTVCLD